MALEQFNIEIIDTETNSRVEALEQISADSASLKYAGGDDKFKALMAGELSFKVLVADGADGKFLHLYTGSETKYKVLLNDTTDPLIPVLIWQGFLFPEQFNEPYTNNIFFVKFMFTDGIGLLKNKYLLNSFYIAENTLPAIISSCLELTGLSMPLLIAPAILNAINDLKLSDLSLSGLAYFSATGKNKTAYFILNAIITAIGCRLFQLKGVWYIIGINRWKDAVIPAEKYDTVGDYLAAENITRTNRPVKFIGVPYITLVSPLKTVTIEWDRELIENLLPTDINYQPLSSGQVLQDPHPVKYWEEIGADATVTLDSTNKEEKVIFTVGGYYNWQLRLPVEDPFYLSLKGYTLLPLSNYIQLSDQYYVEGNVSNNTYLTLEIEFVSYSFYGISQEKIDDGLYLDTFYYELLLDGVTLVSNKPDFDDAAGFSFEFSVGGNSAELIGKLKLKRIGIEKNGYIQLKLHVPEYEQNTKIWVRTGYRKLELNYFTDDLDGYIKNRSIDFTTNEKIGVYHGDDNLDLGLKNILISDAYNWPGIDIVIVKSADPLAMLSYEVLNYLDDYSVTITLSVNDYNKILVNPNNVYMFRSGDAVTWHHLPAYIYTIVHNQTFNIYYFFMSGTVTDIINADDTLFIGTPAYDKFETDKRYLRERWRRYEQAGEDLRYLDALARVYHDAVKDPLIKVNGTLLGIHLPLDIMNFNYISDRPYQITDLEINLFKAETRATLIEQKNENVTDYLIE